METTTTAPRRDAPADWPPRMENPAPGHALAFFETHESGGGRTLMGLEVAPGGWTGTHAPRADDETLELRPGHAGAETALRVLYGLAGQGRLRPDGTPRNLLHLALVTGWAQGRLAGLRGALRPLLPALAAVARLRGVDRELIASCP